MKYYLFVEKQHYQGVYRECGPRRFWSFSEALGSKEERPYSEEEMKSLEGVVSKTNFKRIFSLTEGKFLKFSHSHSGADFGIIRLFDDHVEGFQELDEIEEELKQVKQEIEALIPDSLKDKRKELEKAKKEKKKQLEKLNEQYTKKNYW